MRYCQWISSIFLSVVLFSCKGDNWNNLTVNGIDDFMVMNGTAEYEISGHVIIGTSKTNTPNTFLCTKKGYSDFILEFEVLADSLLNSGVQIRSNSIPSYQDGRVHGYQVEIESSDRKWAGGIYDEGRRGWLYPLTDNPAGQKAFKRGGWNHYRIEAFGPNINTWVNGIQCSRLVDDMTKEGFIGFQVHSIGDPELEGRTIQWKNIKILTDGIENHLTQIDPRVKSINTSEK